MFRIYCCESVKEWGEGLPLLLFAVCEATQDSQSFTHAELIFGDTIRGQLKLLLEYWMLEETKQHCNVLDYVSLFRERLHGA